MYQLITKKTRDLIIGNLINLVICHSVAPSILADSIGSCGILCKPARMIINTKAVCHHTSTPIKVGIAASDEPKKLDFSPIFLDKMELHQKDC